MVGQWTDLGPITATVWNVFSMPFDVVDQPQMTLAGRKVFDLLHEIGGKNRAPSPFECVPFPRHSSIVTATSRFVYQAVALYETPDHGLLNHQR
jgi:hypothetical protein